MLNRWAIVSATVTEPMVTDSSKWQRQLKLKAVIEQPTTTTKQPLVHTCCHRMTWLDECAGSGL